MWSRRGCLALAATCAATLALVGGCDGGGAPAVSSSTTEKGKVHGTVTIKGKPATKGTLSFNPANIERKFVPAAEAPIGEDGTYTVETLIGGNEVTIKSPEAARDPEVSDFRGQFDVKSGDNVYDITIGSP